ncbi:hypothetical protein [Fusibacter ferrireducens]|uniref:Uncharacterized protein n=1 Tax=Fusibacter ferrireducens TaxID=2785058 RepID=A0ABR9ZRA8_9FIRM|nr:hypothetical protein [Fusibacter ferrireducens]MBF4692997.1 hypothetical protein [Fusibacter ferrireducens]
MRQSNFLQHKQTIRMSMSLILIIGFFLPWFTMDPNFSMFATSKAGFSGMSLVMGINFAVQMINAFGTAYNFPASANVIYLGYLLLLIPLLGVIAIILSGLRHKWGYRLHLIQYAFALFVFIAIIIVTNINAEMRELVGNVTNTGFGFYLCLIVSLAGIVYSIYEWRKGKR